VGALATGNPGASVAGPGKPKFGSKYKFEGAVGATGVTGLGMGGCIGDGRDGVTLDWGDNISYSHSRFDFSQLAHRGRCSPHWDH
jgi:hypothetical protein